MESFVMFRDLAIILVAGKYLGLLARKLNAPQVAGEILAGLLVGPCLLNLVQPSDFLAQMAELGVVLLMFGAGLDSNIDEIIKSGPVALMVAMCGVVVPLLAGTGLYAVYYGIDGVGSDSFMRALFLGCVLTATSVTITVQALRELGHLKGKVGTTILSAAIIDDVLGIVVLTVITGFKDPSTSITDVILDTVLFFVFALTVGFLVFQFFERMDLRLNEPPHPPPAHSGAGLLPHDGLYRRSALWRGRHHRRVYGRSGAVQAQGFQLHRTAAGYQLLHDFWAGVFRLRGPEHRRERL